MAEHETIADIIAEKRQYADDLERACNEIAAEAPSLVENMEDYKHTTIADIRREADRLEAAHEREASGNAAKLREALENAAKQLIDATEDKDFGDDVMYLVGCMRTVSQECRAALSAPPRNCDRFDGDIDKLREACARERGLNPEEDFPDVFPDWLLAPSTEKEGGAE